jgi:hypothetical protein
MPKPTPGAGPNQLRAWLKMTLRSGLLDRLPPRYASPGSDGALDTSDYAQELMAELSDPDSGPRLRAETVADALRFRAWVESRLKVSRRIILSEGRTDDEGDIEPEHAARDDGRPVRRTIAPRPAPPRADPMWDDLLDG